MRPLRFPQLAPNKGLAIGSGVAQGLNNAMNNYARMKMQAAQMQAHRMQAQAMMTWRQGQADALKARTAPVDFAKVQALMSLSELHNENNPKAAAAFSKAAQPLIDRMAANMTPDQANQLNAHVKSQIAQRQVPTELSDQLNLNPNEEKYMATVQSNKTRENVAGTAAGARQYVADMGYAGKDLTSSRYTGSRERIALHKDLTSQINSLNNASAALDKAPPAGSIGVDPAAKAELKAGYREKGMALHQQLIDLEKGGFETPGGNPTPQPSSPPGIKPSGKVLPFEKGLEAQPGDIVNHPKEGPLMRVGNHADGSPGFIPAPVDPGRSPQGASVAPQAAPQASQSPFWNPGDPRSASPAGSPLGVGGGWMQDQNPGPSYPAAPGVSSLPPPGSQ